MKQAIIWMLGIAWLAACSKSGTPAAGERAPDTAHTTAPSGTGSDRASTPKAATKDAGFAAYVALFPPLDMPSEFPLGPAAIAEIETRPMQTGHRDSYLCGTRYFDCSDKHGQGDFYYGYRFDISDQATGLVYYGASNTDTQLVLMTYDRTGAIVSGLVLAGDFDDMKYGFDGEIRADKTIVRNRYVWVDGEEKEYVKDRRFRITPTGNIEETIL